MVAIRWQPGDPAVLAQAIIGNVGDEEVQLVLDGNLFLVRRVFPERACNSVRQC